MYISNHRISVAKWSMLFIIFVVMVFLIIGSYLEGLTQTNQTQRQLFWERFRSYIALWWMPIGDFTISIYFFLFGYERGIKQKFYPDSSTGIIKGRKAKKMGTGQIVISTFVLGLASSVVICSGQITRRSFGVHLIFIK